MNAYRCDRCGEYHLDKFKYELKLTRWDNGKSWSSNVMHICPSCVASMNLDRGAAQMIITQANYELTKKEETTNETLDH